MNAQEKLRKAFRINVVPDYGLSGIYKVTFDPKTTGQAVRQPGEPISSVPRSPSVRVDMNDEPPTTTFDGGGFTDPEITPADYQAEAVQWVSEFQKDPCGEKINVIKGPIFIYEFPPEYGDVMYLGHRRFGPGKRFVDMYFAPNSPIGRAVLIVRYGDRKEEEFVAPPEPDGIANHDGVRRQALETAYACARLKGLI